MTYAQRVLVSLTARKIVIIFGASELFTGRMCIGQILSRAKVEVLVVFWELLSTDKDIKSVVAASLVDDRIPKTTRQSRMFPHFAWILLNYVNTNQARIAIYRTMTRKQFNY